MRRSDHYVDIKNFTRKQIRVIKKTIKAYAKFGIIEELRKQGKTYTLLISDLNWEKFRKELAFSLTEAGLV